ncbi:MAG TPA: fumarylacetoacetate hydrolase family protein [Actinomycetota bacterium]|nr:fumarylacetoacetate hydrolase family protein [Actinomycetota bacterium]
MRLARFRSGDRISTGTVGDDDVSPLRGTFFEDPIPIGETLPLTEVRLLAPIIPSKVICIGRNYVEHAEELGSEIPAEPLMFMKPSTAVVGPEDLIRLPPESERVDHEGELAVVIGRPCRRVSEEEAPAFILGYTCGNDVTARDLQKKDGQWTRAKGFDSFCPLGPWVETDLDLSDLEISTKVNGEVRQRGQTSDMIFPPALLVAYVSRVMTLLPGDVILTGTPSGVGPLSQGDRVEVEVEGIGVLANGVTSGD